jgi:putative addiction module component (TIGR02574 family)
VAKVLEKTDPIIRDAIKLPPLERLQLVDSLLESLDMLDKETEELWAKEATRRWEAYHAGTITSAPAVDSLPPSFTVAR